MERITIENEIVMKNLMNHLDIKTIINLSSCNKSLQSSCFKELKRLDVSKYSSLRTKKVLKLLEKCNNLQFINFCGCSIDDGILPFLIQLKSLQLINLMFCYKITAKGILYLTKKIPNLQLIV